MVTATTPISAREPVSETPVMVALREIEKGISAAVDALTFVTDPGSLGDAACELAWLQARLDSLRLGLIDQCRAAGVPQQHGLRTMGQYIASRTNNSPAATNLDTALNKWLRDYPVFNAALTQGEMTLAHVRYIKSQITSHRTFDSLRGDQELLANAARDCGFDDFKKVCDYWLIAVDPDGEEPKDQLAKTGLTMRAGAGGRGRIEIETDAVTFAVFKKMIDLETRKVSASEADNDVVGSGKARQRLKALLGLATRGFQRSDGSMPTPLINLVMSPAVVDWATKQLVEPNNTESIPVDPFNVDGRCELIDGTPIHPLLAVAISGLWNLDTPNLCRYILDANDRIVDYSYNVRVAPAHLRTASLIEHRGACATIGCDADHDWLQFDHIDPHHNGGETTLGNTQPLCEADNKAKAATTGHRPRRDQPPPPFYQPGYRPRSTPRSGTEGDPDAHNR